LGLPLQTIRVTLADADVEPADLVDELIASTSQRIAREQTLLKRLTGVRDSGATSWRDVLDLVSLMQELSSSDPSRRQSVALSDTGAVPVTSIVDALLQEGDPNVAGALQWVLAQSVDDALPHLVDAVRSPDEPTRHRAMAAIVKLPPEAAEPVLQELLDHPDQVLRERAALALGAQGAAEAAPELLDMVVRGSADVDAAGILGQLARRHQMSERVAGLITERLAAEPGTPGARARLTQALADIPGTTAHRALNQLSQDEDPAVSLTARYVLAMHSESVDG
jgi:HEAT repeat protein